MKKIDEFARRTFEAAAKRLIPEARRLHIYEDEKNPYLSRYDLEMEYKGETLYASIYKEDFDEGWAEKLAGESREILANFMEFKAGRADGRKFIGDQITGRVKFLSAESNLWVRGASESVAEDILKNCETEWEAFKVSINMEGITEVHQTHSRNEMMKIAQVVDLYAKPNGGNTIDIQKIHASMIKNAAKAVQKHKAGENEDCKAQP